MVVVALLLRIALILWWHSYEFPASFHHFAFGFETGSVARSLAAGEGFRSPFGDHTGPSAWIAPLYPALCALVFRLFGIFSNASAFVLLSLNSLMGALTCIPLVRIGECTVGRKPALYAGWLWATVPFFMRWPTTWVWDMSASALLLALIFLRALKLGPASGRWAWVGFGALWGVAALTNPSLLSFLPFSLAWPAYRLWRQRRHWLGPVAWSLLTLVVVVSPWLARNRMVFGQFVFLRSNFWFEFHLGNYHLSNGLGWPGKHPVGNPAEFEKYKQLGELGYVAAAREEALEFLRTHPGEFVRLTLKRFLWFWTGEAQNYMKNPYKMWAPWMVLTFSLFAFFGLALAFDRRIPGALLFGLLFLFYPAAYYLTYPQVRYRHAIEPELLLLSVYFLYETLRTLRTRRQGKGSGARSPALR